MNNSFEKYAKNEYIQKKKFWMQELNPEPRDFQLGPLNKEPRQVSNIFTHPSQKIFSAQSRGNTCRGPLFNLLPPVIHVDFQRMFLI